MSGDGESLTRTSLPSICSDGFDMHAVRHSTPESDLHAMDEHEQRPSKGGTTSQGYDISDVDPELIEIPSHTVPSFDSGNAGELSER